MTTNQLFRLYAKDLVVRQFRFDTPQLLPATWDLLVQKNLDTIIDQATPIRIAKLRTKYNV